MLKAIGVIWPILAVVLAVYTAVVIWFPTPAELWIRALPFLGLADGLMALVRFGAKPIKGVVENARAEIQRKNGGQPPADPPPAAGV